MPSRAAMASEAALIKRIRRAAGGAGFKGSTSDAFAGERVGVRVGVTVALPSGTELKMAGCKVADGRATAVGPSVEVLVGVGVGVIGIDAVGMAKGAAGVAIGD